MTLNEVRTLIDKLHKVKELEGEAHRIWVYSESNLMYANLSEEKREKLHEQTYEATKKHAEALGLLMDCIELIRSAHKRELEPRKN